MDELHFFSQYFSSSCGGLPALRARSVVVFSSCWCRSGEVLVIFTLIFTARSLHRSQILFDHVAFREFQFLLQKEEVPSAWMTRK